MSIQATAGARQNGVATMSSQSAVEKATLGWLRDFYKESCGLTCRDSNLEEQLRGVDLWLGGVFNDVGVDAKMDTYTSGNIMLEVISQDRGNASRQTPAVGWWFKDMPWVAYTFVRSGQVVHIDMEKAYPWLGEQLSLALDEFEAHGTFDSKKHGFDMFGTPNRSYITYNLRFSIAKFLAQCPGAYYTDIRDAVSAKAQENALSQLYYNKVRGEAAQTAFRPPMFVGAAPRTLPAAGFAEAIAESCAFYVKPAPDAEKLERLLRLFERHAGFKNDPAVKARGKELQAARVRRTLACDNDAAAA